MIIFGVGTFGQSLAKKAADLGAHVTIVDKDADSLRDIRDLVAEARIIDATDERAVKGKLGDKYDTAVIAMHKDFGAVLLLIIYLREMNIKHIIARAETYMQRNVLTKLGVEQVIMPEYEMGNRVAERLILDRSEQLALTGDEGIVHIPVPQKLIGTTIGDFKKLDSYHLRLIFVRREYLNQDFSRLIEPSDKNTELTKNDYLVLLGKTRRIAKMIDDLS